MDTRAGAHQACPDDRALCRARTRGGSRGAVCLVVLATLLLSFAGMRATARVESDAALAVGRHPRSDAFGYKLAPGPWSVKIIDRLVLHDARRRKNVEMTVRYPAGRATRNHPPFPLILFSPAAGDSRAAFPDLTTHWASYGYVVIVPSHTDAQAPRTRHEVERVPFDEIPLDRLADVVFVVNSVDQIERKMDGFHGRHAASIDRVHVGIAGYATGALTAQMAIGVKVRVMRGGETALESVGDPRFKAAILISPQGSINRMLTRDSWSDLAKPLLLITGSRDVLATSRETPESRQEPYLLARAGQKFLVFIEGATHWSLAGRPRVRATTGQTDGDEVDEPELRMIAGVTASVTLAFWDAWLENDDHGHEYLSSDDVAKFAGGKARLQRR